MMCDNDTGTVGDDDQTDLTTFDDFFNEMAYEEFFAGEVSQPQAPRDDTAETFAEKRKIFQSEVGGRSSDPSLPTTTLAATTTQEARLLFPSQHPR